MNKPKSIAKAPSPEVVHVKFPGPLYKEIKRAAEAEHRSIVNFIQLCVIEALQARGTKF